MANAGPLAAERLNPLLAKAETWARDTLDSLEGQFFEGGYAVGTEKQPAAAQYVTLIRLRDTGDPLYWGNPQAQKDLEVLGKQFGPPPAVAPQEGMTGAAGVQGPPMAPPSSMLQFGGSNATA